MTKLNLIEKVKTRKKVLNISNKNLSKLLNLGYRTISRFFNGEDVKPNTVEKITNLLGLDFAGNEIIDVDTLKEQRAKEKALYIVGLVQDTSALEMQGLDTNELDLLIEDTKQQFLNGDYQKTLWVS